MAFNKSDWKYRNINRKSNARNKDIAIKAKRERYVIKWPKNLVVCKNEYLKRSTLYANLSHESIWSDRGGGV